MEHDQHDIEFAAAILTRRASLDDREVNEWLSSPEHRELLEEMAAIHRAQSQVDFSRYLREDLDRLATRLPRQRRLRGVAWAAAAAAALLVGVWQLVPHRQAEPAGQSVELTLADGTVMRLDPAAADFTGELTDGIERQSPDLINYASPDDATAEAEPIYNTLTVPAGKFFRVGLSDGSKLWINSSTRVRYPMTFSRGERRVYLDGEAYFEVARDTLRPFIVESGRMEVEVYGTQFNINTAGDTYRTVLVSGSVGVRDRESGTEQTLIPGHMATFSPLTGDIGTESVDTYNHTAWREGKIVFDNERMEDIMARLERLYGVEVVYLDDAVRDQRFMGVLTRSDDIEELLYLIQQTSAVSFEVDGNRITVK